MLFGFNTLFAYNTGVKRLANKITLGMAVDIVKYHLSRPRLSNLRAGDDIVLTQMLDDAFDKKTLEIGIDKNRGSAILSEALGARSMNACTNTLKKQGRKDPLSDKEACNSLITRLDEMMSYVKATRDIKKLQQATVEYLCAKHAPPKPEFRLSELVEEGKKKISNDELWNYLSFYLQQGIEDFEVAGCEDHSHVVLGWTK